MTNVQTITLAITIALISGIATFAWNNKTLSEQVEEHNIEVLENCLSKARSKTTSDEILRTAKNCNQDILTKITKPVETITGTHSTGNTVPPLGFQLIPSANAQTNESAENVKTSITLPIECDQKCKIKTLVNSGIGKNLAKEIVTVCKDMAKNPVHCIKYASSVSSAESGGGKYCYKNNCFGIKAGTIGFKTLNEGVIDWVTRYNKYWWKATSMSQFYAPKGKLPYFRYCTSEHSSNSKIGCPFGLKHSSSTFNKITF